MLLMILSEAEGGFNPLTPTSAANFLWTVVIFLAALPLIWKIVMGPVSRALLDRDRMASDAIGAAEKASEEAERARAEVEVRLGEAKSESARMMEEARGRAETREREILEEARREAEVLLERARREIRSEQDKAISAIRAEVVDLSLSAAGQVLGRRVDAEDDKRLARELVESAQAPRAGGGAR